VFGNGRDFEMEKKKYDASIRVSVFSALLFYDIQRPRGITHDPNHPDSIKSLADF